MPTKMTREAASRIQRSECLSNGGQTRQGSFASRAMSAAYKNESLSGYGHSAAFCGMFATVVVGTTLAAAGYAIWYANNLGKS